MGDLSTMHFLYDRKVLTYSFYFCPRWWLLQGVTCDWQQSGKIYGTDSGVGGWGGRDPQILGWMVSLKFIHSFIHLEHLYSAPSRKLLRGASSPTTVKKMVWVNFVS